MGISHPTGKFMAGINKKIIRDSRQRLFDKHIDGTPQAQRLLKKEGKIHVFNDVETMGSVIESIIAKGERTDLNDETDYYERYGLYFSQPIGYQLRSDGTKLLLYYAEIKIMALTNYDYKKVLKKEKTFLLVPVVLVMNYLYKINVNKYCQEIMILVRQ